MHGMLRFMRNLLHASPPLIELVLERPAGSQAIFQYTGNSAQGHLQFGGSSRGPHAR
jgi:hypothetical protein